MNEWMNEWMNVLFAFVGFSPLEPIKKNKYKC